MQEGVRGWRSNVGKGAFVNNKVWGVLYYYTEVWYCYFCEVQFLTSLITIPKWHAQKQLGRTHRLLLWCTELSCFRAANRQLYSNAVLQNHGIPCWKWSQGSCGPTSWQKHNLVKMAQYPAQLNLRSIQCQGILPLSLWKDCSSGWFFSLRKIFLMSNQNLPKSSLDPLPLSVAMWLLRKKQCLPFPVTTLPTLENGLP